MTLHASIPTQARAQGQSLRSGVGYAFLSAVFFAAAVCFSHLHQGSLIIDGVRYAHISWLIAVKHDWLNLYDFFKDAPYHNKPPYLFWMVALSLQIFGFSSFAAKFPAVVFVFAALLLLWRLVARAYGIRAAFFALFLFCANRLFIRAVVDLNFEGMAVCGALCCMSAVLPELRGTPTRVRDSVLFAVGVFLLLASKPPYLVFIWFPVLCGYFSSRALLRVFLRPISLALLVGALVAGSAWMYLGPPTGMYQTAANQIVRPLSISHGYSFNLLFWLRGIFLELAPLSWVGLVAIYREYKSSRYGTPYLGTSERTFLIAWTLPALAIVAAIDFESRYLLIPFLSLCILGGRFLSISFPRFRARHHIRFCTAFGSACFVLFSLLNVPAHREYGVIALLRTLEPTLRAKTPICVGGSDALRSKPTRKRMLMLTELEFGSPIPTYVAETLGTSSAKTGDVVVVEDRCRAALEQVGSQFVEVAKGRGASLLRLRSELPDATRQTVDDHDFSDYH